MTQTHPSIYLSIHPSIHTYCQTGDSNPIVAGLTLRANSECFYGNNKLLARFLLPPNTTRMGKSTNNQQPKIRSIHQSAVKIKLSKNLRRKEK